MIFSIIKKQLFLNQRSLSFSISRLICYKYLQKKITIIYMYAISFSFKYSWHNSNDDTCNFSEKKLTLFRYVL